MVFSFRIVFFVAVLFDAYWSQQFAVAPAHPGNRVTPPRTVAAPARRTFSFALKPEGDPLLNVDFP